MYSTHMSDFWSEECDASCYLLKNTANDLKVKVISPRFSFYECK